MPKRTRMPSGNGSVRGVGGGDEGRSVPLAFSRLCKPCWRRLRVGIRSRLCFGPAKAPVISPRLSRSHQVSHHPVARWLEELPSSLQANRKTQEGSSHPDRKAPCEPINQQVQAFQKRGQPGGAVDAQKKALIGDCKHAGRAWHPQGQPVKVRSKACVDQHLGKGIP